MVRDVHVGYVTCMQVSHLYMKRDTCVSVSIERCTMCESESLMCYVGPMQPSH